MKQVSLKNSKGWVSMAAMWMALRRLSIWWMCAPALLMLLVLFMLPMNESRKPWVTVEDPPLPLRDIPNVEPVQAVINAIREATRSAAATTNVGFSERDAEFHATKCEGKLWEKYHPCTARTELGPCYARRPHKKLLEPNSQWDALLKEYSILHRTCMNGVGNITQHFLSGPTTLKCKFLIVEIRGVGLGNKVGLLTSAVLYAVLTQRVILVNGNSYIPWTMCEPFLGSSWLLNDHFPLPTRYGWENTMLGRWAGWESPIWKSSTYFAKAVDGTKVEGDAFQLYAVKIDHSHPEQTRFYCNADQAYLTQVTWLHFTGCLYFLPKLFAVPAFRPVLEGLFSNPSLALTYMLRTVMLPSNEVWNQVKREDSALFANADRRVGIQVRFLFGRNVKFSRASRRVNSHVKQCVTENDILPTIIPKATTKLEVSPARTPQTTRVLVTSLHRALYDELVEMYSTHDTISGEVIRVAQLTSREKQLFSVHEDTLAFVEILLLSFVDELLVTPLSTFGGLAQAYGAIIPWFIEVKKSTGSCVRAQTLDICYQRAQLRYECPHNADVDRKPIKFEVPYIKTCLPIEESDGVQLVSP